MTTIKTSGRWKAFGNIFAQFIASCFYDGQPFTVSHVKDLIAHTKGGKELNKLYKQHCDTLLPDYASYQHKRYNGCWSLNDFERTNRWMEFLYRQNVVNRTTRKIGTKGFGCCKYLYTCK